MSDPADPLRDRILNIRGHRVILDADLAHLYGVTTKAFNQAIKRNAGRFPEDFAFQLSADETERLRSQIVTSNVGRGGRRYSPYAFTEHGALMAANVLNSEKAIEMAIYVVRAFIKQREALATNATILKRLAEVDKTLIEHDSALQILWKKLQPLLTPPPDPPRRRIGFRQQISLSHVGALLACRPLAWRRMNDARVVFRASIDWPRETRRSTKRISDPFLTTDGARKREEGEALSVSER